MRAVSHELRKAVILLLALAALSMVAVIAQSSRPSGEQMKPGASS